MTRNMVKDMLSGGIAPAAPRYSSGCTVHRYLSRRVQGSLITV